MSQRLGPCPGYQEAMSDDDNKPHTYDDEIGPVLAQAMSEVEAVLAKHDLAGILMLATKTDDAAWVTHFPEWTLLDVDGERVQEAADFARRRPGESVAEAAERTMQLIDTLATMTDQALTDCANMSEELEEFFISRGMLEVHDVSEPENDPKLKPN